MLTLTEAKNHIRVDQDFDDAAIMDMIKTATAACANYLNVDHLDFDAPAPVKSAGLLLVAELYEFRESAGDRLYHRNPTFEMLLNPYRTMSF